MLLRKYLTNFSLQNRNCRHKLFVQTITSISAQSYYQFTKIMGCSFSKNSKVLNITETNSKPTMATADDDFIEDVVCKTSDVQEKEMKVFELQDAGKVLVIRQNGTLSALGANCTHYGAPLQSSALGDGRLRCQWHGACFNITTGDIEDFPGLDSLPCYKVTVEGDNVKVRARRSELKANKRVKQMAKNDSSNSEHFVVIGGGPSSAVCVETLRQEGFEGKITLVSRENYLPYDRIKLDKAMDIDIAAIQLRTSEFYTNNGIDVLTGCAAASVDTKQKQVKLKDGKTLSYDSIYVATGSQARKANIPGSDLQNVIVIREYDDVRSTQTLLTPEKHVVILGSSFIGMEVAAYCSNKVAKVTVVSKDSVPFQAALGKDIGAAVLKLFETNGVNFIPESGLSRCIDNGNGAVGSVELVNGSILQADICVMGVGSTLNTEFLANSGITINERGAVDVNEYLETNVANIFAGGDIANAPVWSHGNAKAAIGHYGLAQYHGRIAALNMLNKQTPVKNIPYFWTMFLGKGIRYAGYGRFDDIIYSGDVPNLKFVAFFVNNDVVTSIASCGMDPIVSQYAEYVMQGNKLHRNDLKDDPLAWSR